MRGDLNQTRLPALLRRLRAGRKNGILRFGYSDGERRIVFKSGSIVLVDSDAVSDALGEFLVRTGRLGRSDLDSARELVTRSGRSLSDALEAMKLLSKQEMDAAEIGRIQSILGHLVASFRVEFQFEETDHPVALAKAYNIPLEQSVLASVRKILDLSVLRALVGDSRTPLQVAVGSAPLLESWLSAEERSLLTAARAYRQGVSAQQILDGAPLGELETLRCVYALISVGLLKPEALPTPAVARGPEPPVSTTSGKPPFVEEAAAQTPRRDGMSPRRLGRFEVQRLLKQGSMGEVFRGRDPEKDRTVAIKLLRSVEVLAPDARQAYLEKLRARVGEALRLEHEAIAATLNAGMASQTCPFLVLEFVSGTTLQGLLQSGPVSPAHAMELATQICSALAYAHSHGVVHGQVKPANILVTPEGLAKLKDFGLPRLPSSETETDQHYLSPEQLTSHELDTRTDIFAFGVVCYRMLTGGFPYPDRPSKVEADPLPFAPELRAETPTLFRHIVLRCLAADSTQRYSDARELQAAFAGKTEPPKPVPSVGEASQSSPPSAPHPTEVQAPPVMASTEPLDADPATQGEPFDASQATRAELEESFRAIQELPDASGRPEETSKSADAPQREGEQAPELSQDSQEVEKTAPPPRPETREKRSRAWKLASFAAGIAALLIPVGAGGLYVLEQEPAWVGLPAPVRFDVSVTPIPFSSPSERVLESLLRGPSDEALIAEAESALSQGDLSGSRHALDQLLARSPDYPGAKALLANIERIETQRRLAEEQRRLASQAPEPEPEPVAEEEEPGDAELFARAENAFARGDYIDSKAMLQALVQLNPQFSGATQLMEVVDKKIWTMTLPKSFGARHNHRLGGCEGTMVLSDSGLSFGSDDHEWTWSYGQLVSLDRPDAVSFNIVTGERDFLGLLKNKRYRFELREFFSEEDWHYFRETVYGPNSVTATPE